MVKEKRMRLEVAGSIPSQRIFCINILVQGALRTFRVPVTITGTKGQFEPIPLAVFLVVSVRTRKYSSGLNLSKDDDEQYIRHMLLLHTCYAC